MLWPGRGTSFRGSGVNGQGVDVSPFARRYLDLAVHRVAAFDRPPPVGVPGGCGLDGPCQDAALFVAHHLDGPGDQTFREAIGPTQPKFDAEEARRLFQRGIEELGENPTIELLAYDDSTARDIATFLQSQLEDNLGAKIDVKVQPFDRKLELEASDEFQLSWQGWIGDYNDPMTFLELFETGNAFNTYGYSNARYDDLVSRDREELDEKKRMDMLIEAERVLVEETAGCAPMYFRGRPGSRSPSSPGSSGNPTAGARISACGG